MSLAGLKDSRDYLQKSLLLFAESYPYEIRIGLEVEFALRKVRDDASDINVVKESILTISRNNGVPLLHFEKEQGENQYEVALKHSADVIGFADKYYHLKNIIKESAAFHGYEVDFSTMSVGNHSNSLHMHISLWQGDVNLFAKTATDGFESKNMAYAIAGILSHAKSLCLFALNSESDFKRFREKFSLAKERVRHEASNTNAPTHIAWGSNNRTCLVRIPDSYNDPENRHIEYRLPVPEADIYLVISTLLLAIYLGFKEKKDPIPKTYGNAYDKQYGLEPLPQTYRDAENAFKEDKKFKQIFDKLIEVLGK